MKAFIIPVITDEKIKNKIIKKCEFIGYEAVFVTDNDKTKTRKNRIKNLIECDIIFQFEMPEVISRDMGIDSMESRIATYLGIPVYDEDYLNKLVADKVAESVNDKEEGK